MTPNPGDPNDRPDTPGDQQGGPPGKPGGKPQRRFRPRRKPADSQAMNNLPENRGLAGAESQNRNATPDHTQPNQDGQNTFRPNNPNQQNNRRRQGRPHSGQKPPRAEGTAPGSGQDPNQQPGERQNNPNRQNNNRQGNRPGTNNRGGNRNRNDFRDRRGNNGAERTGPGQSTPTAGRDDNLPPPPPNELPTFIGPEFRRVDYPENRRSNQQANRADAGSTAEPGTPGNNAPGNNAQRRRRGNRGRGGGNQNQQRPQRDPAATPEKAPVAPQPSAEKRSFESYREAKRTNQGGGRGQNQPGNRGRQQNRRDGRPPQPQTRPDNTYVSLSDRYNFDRPAPSVPIPTDRGIKLRSQRGGMTRNWWARRWIDAMERLVDPHRLQRGRTYARSGQVLSIQETRAGVEAMVQGSRPQPYKVTIQVTHLSSSQWDQVVDALSEQALFTAQLLAGEMPGNIESAFETAGVSLFPNRSGDLSTDCSCPDWANPCKHVAASHYILGDRFDDDPFLLFRMRGRTQEQILDALRQRRGGQELDPDGTEQIISTAPSLDDQMLHFWEPAEDLDSFPLTINPPTVDMPLLKRLGEPNFLAGESLLGLLKPVYDSFTRSALRAAYSEEEPVESNPTEENGG